MKTLVDGERFMAVPAGMHDTNSCELISWLLVSEGKYAHAQSHEAFGNDL